MLSKFVHLSPWRWYIRVNTVYVHTVHVCMYVLYRWCWLAAWRAGEARPVPYVRAVGNGVPYSSNSTSNLLTNYGTGTGTGVHKGWM